MEDTVFLPVTELSRRIESGVLDPRALARAYLERADTVGRPLNCYVALCGERAMAEADVAAQRAERKQRLSPLDGIPVAVKDNIDVAGVPTTNGFGGTHHVVDVDAEVIRRLRGAGVVVLGKLNMQEGALGGVNDNPHHGRTTNPYRDGYTPGGSSGGSAAAVAAGLCAAALGTDTGGSVRIPAAYCGVVGLKPSYGRVSTRGVVPLSCRLDHVGPLTRTVADAELMLVAMMGFDADWPYARAYPAQDDAPLPNRSPDRLRVGILANYAQTPMEPDVWSRFDEVLQLLEKLGAEISYQRLPTYDVVRGRRAVFVRVDGAAAPDRVTKVGAAEVPQHLIEKLLLAFHPRLGTQRVPACASSTPIGLWFRRPRARALFPGRRRHCCTDDAPSGVSIRRLFTRHARRLLRVGQHGRLSSHQPANGVEHGRPASWAPNHGTVRARCSPACHRGRL
jgi:Asp-tRNA(Asn)/Glu-tRNA(Gln) amidotransferase A subunit family amidase